ncbi:30S ribosomal protein S16 [Capnocytophaga sp. G2]|uniref:30S ribosomal protein S16 n=1 Tax=Capnocytophaga sp. G2 TaxID=3110695 RepID=UPI002B497DD2|nr:30S ribosomal protein S16 [Capnocytophaga sp. G2]MEB3004280.1 30S ribosomal protein S16 [Capnocytophaga sp. G2]
MPVKIRLQRHGKKGKPFYWVVAADVRASRDGKFLQKLGTYNPTTNPAQIELNIDEAIKWLHFGAQPTDTARRILSYKGVMLKYHLEGGVKKGALTKEQADAKFAAWLTEKEQKINAKKEALQKGKVSAKQESVKAEQAYSQKRKEAIAAKAQAAEAPAESSEEGANETEA